MVKSLNVYLFFFFKTKNRKALEKHYADLENIITQRQTSARIRFMIQDLLDLRRVREENINLY